MLETAFGFKGRIGRVRYLLSALALGFVLLFSFAFLLFAFGFHPADRSSFLKPIILTSLIVLPFNLWVGLSLQACRFRNIGWNPIVAILGWFGFNLICQVMTVVGAGAGHGLHGMGLGGPLIMLSLLSKMGVLLLWPGASYDFDNRIGGDPGLSAPAVAANPSSPTQRPLSAARIAVASGGFGRRGL